MFFQTPGNGTAVHPPSQAQLYIQDQKLQAAAQVAQSIQHHLQKTYVAQQQNQVQPTFHIYQPTSHPNLVQSLGLGGYGDHGQQPNNYNINYNSTEESNNNNLSSYLQNEVKPQNSTSPTPTTPSNANGVISRPTLEPLIDETLKLEDLEEFSKFFKQRRIKLGFTQADVGLALGKLYGYDCSQTTVSRFEALNLSFSNMCKLKSLLERWFKEKDKSLRHSSALQSNANVSPEAIGRRRKKRTFIGCQVRAALERAFMQNIKPSTEEIVLFAEKLGMEREIVRIWFCNRRQKERRLVNEGISGFIRDSQSPMFTQHDVFSPPGMSSFLGSSVSP